MGPILDSRLLGLIGLVRAVPLAPNICLEARFGVAPWPKHAISCGAQVIVGLPGRLKKNATDSLGVIFIEVADTYKAYADISANYFGNPAEDLVLVAVTGTNGKTTVTYIVEDILKEAGVSVGVVGTVNNRYTTRDGKTTFLPTRFTTPEAFSLQQVLKEMSDHDIEIVIIPTNATDRLARF